MVERFNVAVTRMTKLRITIVAVPVVLILLGGTTVFALADDINTDPLFFDPNSSETPFSLGCGGQHLMRQVATITSSGGIVTNPVGLDLDHDNLREFILLELLGDSQTEFYESVGDDAFELVHALDAKAVVEAGDLDEDGLADLLVQDLDGFDSYYRLYESTSSDTYPTEIVWEVLIGAPGVVPGFADVDGDGMREFVQAGIPERLAQFHLRIFEHDGDNSFGLTFDQALTGVSVLQAPDIADDLDGDGRMEILLGAGTANGFEILAFESSGNDVYEQTWSVILEHGGNPVVVSRVPWNLSSVASAEFVYLV